MTDAFTTASLAAGAIIAVGVVAILIVASRRARHRPSRPIAEVLAGTLDGAPRACIVTNAAGTVVYRNQRGREWLGTNDPAAFLGERGMRDFDREDGISRLIDAARARLVWTADIPLAASGAKPGDEPEWHRVGVRTLDLGGPGGEGLMLWTAEDVTAHRTIAEIIGQERQDAVDFLYFLPVGIYSADVDGVLGYVNQRFAEWLGYASDDLTGKKLDDVLVGPTRPQIEGEWQGEVQFRTRGGEPFTAFVMQSTYDDAGETRTRTTVVRDMTRLQAGNVGAEHFRALFDAAPVAIALTDAEGVIADCNHAFERLVGRNRSTLAGTPLADRLVEDDRRSFAAEVDKMLTGEGEGMRLDVSVIAPSRRDGMAQASVFLGALAGTGPGAMTEGAVAHFIDVTDQKSLEVQFAQAQKMQAMGQLAGGVAHDFNNLLTAMIGFCDLLLQRHTAGDPSFADIMQIKQNANRAANLVRQLLAFSRKQPLQPKELNVTDELTELSHLLTRLIGESIRFRLVHGRELGLIRVDPGQFDQMVINLAVNARDAMPGGGTLTISTGVETFDLPTQLGAEQVPPGRYVRICVEDTGKGIAPENLGRIFEPFFSTKKEIPGAGTGLGLATVYGIVRQTGGFILVDSSPGEGAKFTIYLPRYAPEAEDGEGARVKVAAPAAVEEPQRVDFTRPGNVLLVEDEDAVRVFAARALKSKGYKVFEARTGEQALDILKDQPAVDIMVTDMMMPGMDGGTLARLIRTERPEIKILLISGYSEEVARGDIVDTADFHFLPKPFSLSQLVSKVKDVLKETSE